MTEIPIAALKGLGFYFLTVVFVVHGFVALKWETANADGRYTVETLTTPEIPQDLIQWRDWHDSSSSEAPSLKEVETMRDTIKSVTAYRGVLVDQADEVLEAYESKLQKLKPMDDLKESVLSEGNHTFRNLRLDNLLQRESLSDLTEKGIEILFTTVLKELKSISERGPTARWNTLNDVVSPKEPHPAKEKLLWKDLEKELCSLPPLKEELDDDDDEDTPYLADDDPSDQLSLYAQESDLANHLKQVRSLLAARSKNPQVHLEKRSAVVKQFTNATEVVLQSIETAHANMDKTLKEISDNIADTKVPAKSNKNRNPDCDAASPDDVKEFMDAGLNALARKADVRDALLEVLEILDPEAAKNLILDADLNADPALPPIPSPENFSLVKLLDSPVIGKMDRFVDGLLDRIGGYFDSFDSYMDRQTEKYVDSYDENASSLGKVYVVHLLIRSGHLKVPLPKILRESLESSHRGRALLASLS